MWQPAGISWNKPRVHEIKVCVCVCGSQRARTAWAPSESLGRHAETIKGETVEKTETVTNSLSKGLGGWGGVWAHRSQCSEIPCLFYVITSAVCVCVCVQPSVNKDQHVYGKWKEHGTQAGPSKQKCQIIKQPHVLAD